MSVVKYRCCDGYYVKHDWTKLDMITLIDVQAAHRGECSLRGFAISYTDLYMHWFTYARV